MPTIDPSDGTTNVGKGDVASAAAAAASTAALLVHPVNVRTDVNPALSANLMSVSRRSPTSNVCCLPYESSEYSSIISSSNGDDGFPQTISGCRPQEPAMEEQIEPVPVSLYIHMYISN